MAQRCLHIAYWNFYNSYIIGSTSLFLWQPQCCKQTSNLPLVYIEMNWKVSKPGVPTGAKEWDVRVISKL